MAAARHTPFAPWTCSISCANQPRAPRSQQRPVWLQRLCKRLAVLATLSFSAVTLGLSVLTSRLLLVAFLEERNAELARSIRRAATESNAPVVAILGGLHVNGVARLLMTDRTPDADSPRDADGVWWDVPADLDTAKWI